MLNHHQSFFLNYVSRPSRPSSPKSVPSITNDHKCFVVYCISRPDLVTVTPPSPTTSRAPPTTTRERRARSLSGASPAPQLSLALDQATLKSVFDHLSMSRVTYTNVGVDQARGDYVVYSEASGVRKKSRARRVAPT